MQDKLKHENIKENNDTLKKKATWKSSKNIEEKEYILNPKTRKIEEKGNVINYKNKDKPKIERIKNYDKSILRK